MARIELPESRLRARKRKRRLLKNIFSITLVLFVLFGLVGLTYLPALQIKSISVSGEQALSSSAIITFVQGELNGEYWYVFPKSNIFLYPKKQITADLIKMYPVLASADVHAGDFETVAVSLVERQPRALLCGEAFASSSPCYFMDENGVAYGNAPIFSEPVYTIYSGVLTGDVLPKQFLTPAEFQSLSALVDAIDQKLSDEKVSTVVVDDSKDVHVQFDSGFTITFALSDQGGDVFERLILAFTAEPLTAHKLSDFEYLDLRFGDKLYYKLR